MQKKGNKPHVEERNCWGSESVRRIMRLIGSWEMGCSIVVLGKRGGGRGMGGVIDVRGREGGIIG